MWTKYLVYWPMILFYKGFLALSVKEFSCQCRRQGSVVGLGRFLENEIAIHLIILDWEIPWAKSGRMQSMGSRKNWHDWASKTYPIVLSAFPNTVFHCSNFRHSGDWVFYSHLNYIHFMINVVGTNLCIYCQFVLLWIVSKYSVYSSVPRVCIYIYKYIYLNGII